MKGTAGEARKLNRRQFCVLLGGALQQARASHLPGPIAADGRRFPAPPLSARPYVLWMWMGCNVSREGITRDLEAMREAGIGGATIYTVADTVNPWPSVIGKSPTPEIVAFTEPWWAMVRHAAETAHRLGLELILHNCAGYESSGGTWITPELSMQEIVWSEHAVSGGQAFDGVLERAVVDPHPHEPYPLTYIPELGRIDIPVVKARTEYYRDIAVLAFPKGSSVRADEVQDLTALMSQDGRLRWNAPKGEWTVIRFGHTTTGAMISPAQWNAMGLECDKLSREAVTFHVQHVLAEMKRHLGEQMGKGVTTLYFDSYEAGTPNWTPRMREEFRTRRGYDLLQWLPVFAGRTVNGESGTKTFQQDFRKTIEDLFRDVYWSAPGPLIHEAGLKQSAEPYVGPWKIEEVVPHLDIPVAEFWTHGGVYSPAKVDEIVRSAAEHGQKIVAAEAFTSSPEEARWSAYPGWLKPIGDAAFCGGVNRLQLHHFVHQPWPEVYRPGNVMGQWGVHFGRLQTWWEPGKEWLAYLWRCQSLLQRGVFVEASAATSVRFEGADAGLSLRSAHRRDGSTEIYFVANTGWKSGKATLVFPLTAKHAELWDPVRDTVEALAVSDSGSSTTASLSFAEAQSYFVVFRAEREARPMRLPARRAAASRKPLAELPEEWTVQFDPAWGGPAKVTFPRLMDWTKHEDEGIRFYSGTAVYRTTFRIAERPQRALLELGVVRHLAEVRVNDVPLGVVWTAPWEVEIARALRPGINRLEVRVTNTWANRLIGDEHHPADMEWTPGDARFKAGASLKEFPDWFLQRKARPTPKRLTFTTWNYFTKESPLRESGLLGPVRLMREDA